MRVSFKLLQKVAEFALTVQRI